MVEEIERKKKQKEDRAAIGRDTVLGRGTQLGCVGGPSSLPPYRPTQFATAGASVSTSASISGSATATATSHAPTTSSHSGNVTIGPRIRKSRLDSFFVPRTTPGSQLSLEGMGWNKEVHDAAKMAIGRFWSYSCIPFFVARSPYWQQMVDAITICGAGFKAPSESDLRGPILSQMVDDVKKDLDEQRHIWSTKRYTIMTDANFPQLAEVIGNDKVYDPSSQRLSNIKNMQVQGTSLSSSLRQSQQQFRDTVVSMGKVNCNSRIGGFNGVWVVESHRKSSSGEMGISFRRPEAINPDSIRELLPICRFKFC
ncbi:uncharacterized protein LOC131858858 [Cryptomeria japonica]|uniref:uncharacterized protein LOC131858858 n=1 Tax=Cryptomeria japonica TaxID=3369 RepID=UPI0027D9F4E1|nr:uncharacterized protein LOC131858858 [Cryptomeria japonica]